MSTSFNNNQVKIRKSLLIFLKSASAPLVIYPKNLENVYSDLKKRMVQSNINNPQLIELEAMGPIKIFSITDTQISALAIQEEVLQG